MIKPFYSYYKRDINGEEKIKIDKLRNKSAITESESSIKLDTKLVV